MRILDQNINFKDNLHYSLKRYPVWWIILIITMVFDFFSTSVFIAKYGTEAEANITTRFMMETFNPYFGNLLGKFLQLISVVCLVSVSRRVGNFFLLFVILINCWAIVVNSLI